MVYVLPTPFVVRIAVFRSGYWLDESRMSRKYFCLGIGSEIMNIVTILVSSTIIHFSYNNPF